MNQKLTIDDIHIGYVKRYFYDRKLRTWTFVLDTIDTASDKYQLQVVVDADRIKLFTSSNGLSIVIDMET